MIRVPAEVERSFMLPASPEAAYAALRDVPTWAALFPGVEAIEPLAPDVWQWEMEPMGPPAVQVRTIYACRYTFDDETRTVAWAPEPGVGNATFEGAVTLAPEAGQAPEASGGTCSGALWLEATLEVPAPRFVAGVVKAAIGVAFGQMTDRFLDRLAEHVRTV
ncbi:MAG: SRPBCC family protein [Bacteroidota bacterium]